MARLVGFWPLNKEYLARDVSGNENHALVSCVKLDTGLHQVTGGSYAFRGQPMSYIEIPNNGALDVRKAVTIAMYVYITTDSNGPLVEWMYPGVFENYGIHIYAFKGGIFYVNYVKRASMSFRTEKLSWTMKRNTWNYIATSYSVITGEAKIYHNGKTVVSKYIGKYELETSRSIRIGARDKTGNQMFAGKMTCLQIYDDVINVEDIFTTVKDRCKLPGKSSVEKLHTH